MRAFQAVQGVVIVLDGTHHEVEFAVFHVHPHHVALEVVVGTERFAASLEVALQAFILGQADGLVK